MTTWTDGYVTDIPYTSNFYRELTPRWLVTVATLQGQHAPDIERPYTYCELGCGQGFGAALMAASNPKGQFWAIDFNPAQIVNAQRLTKAANLSNITFIEASFEEMLMSPEGVYPQFDFIVMHGIYSWVSRENQQIVTRILHRFLKPGGLVHNSYNCHPGWAPFVPAQKAIELYAAQHPDRSDRQVEAGLRFLQRLREAEAKAVSPHSALSTLLDKACEQSRNYLAHEYLDSNWFIHHVADVIKDMGEAKLSYIGSAHFQDNLNAVSLPAKVLPMLQEIRDISLLETVKDLARNQNFRRDIYVRGSLAMTESEWLNALQKVSLLPLQMPPAGEIKFRTPMGEASAKESVYRPLLNAMVREPLSFSSVTAHASFATLPLTEVIQTFGLLIGGGYGHPLQPLDEEEQKAVWECAQAFNRATIERVLSGHDLAYLAAPAIGSGLSVDFHEMAAVKVLMEQPEISGMALVEAVWRLFVAGKKLLLKEGKPLETVEQNVDELSLRLREFETNKLPVWRKLGVLP